MDLPCTIDQAIRAVDVLIAGYIETHCEVLGISNDDVSQTERIMRGLLTAAVNERDSAKRNIDKGYLKREFDTVVDLIDDLRAAVTPGREILRLDFWKRASRPFAEVKRERKVPYINRLEIEQVAYQYLQLPYRCVTFDRLLVDMLTASEMFAYAETILLKNPFETWLGISSSPLFARPIWAWFIGQVFNLVIHGVTGGFIWYAASKEWLGYNATLWAASGVFGIWCLLFALSIMYLPFRIYHCSRLKAHTLKQLNAMDMVYISILEGTLTSSKHMICRLESAAEYDVIWPSILFVLLDDITARSGRF